MFFTQFFDLFDNWNNIKEGVFKTPFSGAKISLVDGSNVAELIAECLTDESHLGKKKFEISKKKLIIFFDFFSLVNFNCR